MFHSSEGSSGALTTICATIVHQEGGRDKGAKLMERIETATYEACRDRRLQLETFPDVAPLVAELQKLSGRAGENSPPGDANSFKVTAQQPGGALVVKEQFFEQFGDIPEFDEIIQRHNSEYNKDGIRLKEAVATPQKPETLKAALVSPDEPLTAAKLSSLPNAQGPESHVARRTNHTYN